MMNILTTVMENEWNQGDVVQMASEMYYVVSEDKKTLTEFSSKEWTEMIKRGLLMSQGKLYRNEMAAKFLFIKTITGDESDIIIIDELLRLTSCIDRSLSRPKNSLTLAGRSGTGRKTALSIVSALHGSRLMTLNMSHEYSIKNFKIDLKAVSIIYYER